MEQQAFGRVFRIGQSKETYFYRIMVKNSIDGRLLKLQNQKLEQINAVLKDSDPAKQRLTESDVAGLFGRITRSANGQLIVERDYDDESEEDDEDGKDENSMDDEEEEEDDESESYDQSN